MFFKGSRYEKVKNYIFKRQDGSEVLLKKKRRIPEQKGRLIHTVLEGERSDLAANRYYGDPLKFWKIADGNAEMNPENLFKRPGEKIIIPPNDPEI
ncbi:hypothetical protein HY745_03675 [Candidatus Desantisbacteria bacterium]|nr:hypothetical protein [Candidatus Desantisbacteria bacterium]